MRKQYIRQTLPALRFRRWSRKRYAAFISRQRACTMGTLRCNIIERLQQKNGSVTEGCLVPTCQRGEEDSPAAAASSGACLSSETEQEMLLQTGAVVLSRVQTVAVAGYSYIYNVSRKSGKLRCKAGASRFSCLGGCGCIIMNRIGHLHGKSTK